MSALVSLPNSWVLTTIDAVCDFHAGFGFPTEMQGVSGQELPFYKVKDVSVAWLAQSAFLIETEHSLSCGDAKRIKAKPVPKGTVVFAKIGEALRLNRRAIIPRPSLIDNNLMGIEAPPTRLASRYLFWFTLATKFDVDARASVVPSIRKSDIGNLSFPLPPLAEQTRIVAKLEELLSDLDAGVAELKAAQKKLARYRQSLLKAAVEGALTAAWRAQHTPTETGAQLLQRILTERRARWEAKQLAKFKAQGKTPPKDWQKNYPEPVQPDITGLPQLPEGWVWASVDQLTEFITSGSRGWADYYAESGSTFIRSQNINKDRLDLSDIAFVNPPEGSEGARTRVQKDDVLLTITGANVGKSARVEIELNEAYVSQHVALLRVVDPGLSWFLHLFLTAEAGGRGQLNKEAYGAGKPGLNLQQVAAVLMPLPGSFEIHALLSAVFVQQEAADANESAITASLKQSTAQRQNILRAAFAGQLVPQDPNDEPASVLLERIRAERAKQAAAKKPRVAVKKPRGSKAKAGQP